MRFNHNTFNTMYTVTKEQPVNVTIVLGVTSHCAVVQNTPLHMLLIMNAWCSMVYEWHITLVIEIVKPSCLSEDGQQLVANGFVSDLQHDVLGYRYLNVTVDLGGDSGRQKQGDSHQYRIETVNSLSYELSTINTHL